MATINEAIRISKRILLSNLLTNDYNLAITPLLSGKHGIGKSQVPKNIAQSLNGTCITIEGGTLKEGEITGIPYQYKNEFNEIEFKFLPYYVIKRIQEAEKILNNENNSELSLDKILEGTENFYSNNDLTFEEKINAIKLKKVKPVIIFFDEINRTDNAVFRELMNIILTRTVNGYRLPWWVLIIAAMNPSTQNSIYSTNEMDPAQLDRFIKIKVRDDSTEWINYALKKDFDETIINFIANHEKNLSDNNSNLEDEDMPTPSPRGWEMINLILSGKDKLDEFFKKEELTNKDDDIRTIMSSKLGASVTSMYYTSLKDKSKIVTAKDIFNYDNKDIDDKIVAIIKEQSTVRNSITCKSILDYLVNNFDNLKSNNNIIKNKLKIFIELIDKSNKLSFCQNLVDLKTINNKEIYDYIYDIFDDNILELLEFTNYNTRKIEVSN